LKAAFISKETTWHEKLLLTDMQSGKRMKMDHYEQTNHQENSGNEIFQRIPSSSFLIIVFHDR
jgi:hypothetical protein